MPKVDLSSLTEIEKKALKGLTLNFQSMQELSKSSNLDKDSCYRAASWLNDKGFAELKKETIKQFNLTKEGDEAEKNGLIEELLVKEIAKQKGKANFSSLMKSSLKQSAIIAVGIAKKKSLIVISKQGNEAIAELTGFEKEFSFKDYAKILKEIKENKFDETKLNENQKNILKELIERKLVLVQEKNNWQVKANKQGIENKKEVKFENEIIIFSSKELKSGEWKQKKFRTFNLQDPVPEIFAGKRQPYLQFLKEIRRKLIELGFQEMPSNLIELEFYNFDVLFQPQNHPARAWTDTYQLKQPTQGDLPGKKIVDNVKAMHENGGVSESRGWNYKWDEKIAAKLMPAAHGTAASARQILNNPAVPGKYFALSRVYRPDVLDATHLSEFNQMEGIVLDKELNFKNLLGLLKEFAIEFAGAEKVKFVPDYYPFTEPSVQLNAYSKELGWIELGGAGMFRPEMTQNLGLNSEVIAWGVGIDRIAMMALGIKDIRYLFSQDLNWLRKSKLPWVK